MACKVSDEDLARFALAELADDGRAAVEGHLLTCRSCLMAYFELRHGVDTAAAAALDPAQPVPGKWVKKSLMAAAATAAPRPVAAPPALAAPPAAGAPRSPGSPPAAGAPRSPGLPPAAGAPRSPAAPPTLGSPRQAAASPAPRVAGARPPHWRRPAAAFLPAWTLSVPRAGFAAVGFAALLLAAVAVWRPHLLTRSKHETVHGLIHPVDSASPGAQNLNTI